MVLNRSKKLKSIYFKQIRTHLKGLEPLNTVAVFGYVFARVFDSHKHHVTKIVQDEFIDCVLCYGV